MLRLCQVVQIARSSFYKWLATAPIRAARRAADEVLAARIAQVHAQDAVCGAPRITVELNDGAGERERVHHKRVARVMRAHHIAGIRLRRRVRTTVPDPDGQLVPDLLGRDFTAVAPNKKCVGDITYLPCEAGQFLYLATVIDCFSRRLVGWSIAEHMRTDLVADALRAAARERGLLAGATFHSDQGGQGRSDSHLLMQQTPSSTRGSRPRQLGSGSSRWRSCERMHMGGCDGPGSVCMDRDRMARRVQARLSWAWVVVAGGYALAHLQALWVNARMMQPPGYGGPTWLERFLATGLLVLSAVLLVRLVIGHRFRPEMGWARWALTLWVWFSVGYGQWASVVAKVSLHDPLDHDSTPAEILLLTLALAVTVVALWRGFASSDWCRHAMASGEFRDHRGSVLRRPFLRGERRLGSNPPPGNRQH